MEWKITCRKKGMESIKYTTLQEKDPQAALQLLGGSGSAVDPQRWKLRAENQTDEPWCGVLRLELHFRKENPQFYLPAFLYGRNKGEWAANNRWLYPRLREGEIRLPFSPWWMVRSDRLSHPAAFVFDGGRMLGLDASPYFLKKEGQIEAWEPGKTGEFYQYGGFGCSLEDGFIAYTIGYENAPFFFLNSDTVTERAKLNENCFVLSPGEAVEAEIRTYDYAADTAEALGEAMESVYKRFHEPPRKKSSIKQTVSDLAKANAEDAWRSDGKNYATQAYLQKDGSLTFNEWFSISWTGGVEVATPMLMAAHRLENEEMRMQALSCIQNVVDCSMNPAAGLPYDSIENGKWSTGGWWKDHLNAKGHASYLVGQAVFYILKAWEYEKRLGGTDHDDWLAFAEKVITRMEETKNSDQEYPYIWSEKTGAGLEYDSFGGTWCLASSAYYSWLTGDLRWLEGLRRSENHYYENWLQNMACYGTPLDTDKAMDSEGILAYIKAVRYLHAITGDALYLDHLKTALSYEFTYKFCYNSPVSVPPLSHLGWSSCGGSVTSTCNPHIHPMSNNVVDEMLYYLDNREDLYVKRRLEDTVLWGCQTYNTFDGEYDFGKKGWMSERFCHSEGLLVEHYEDGTPASTWFALLPWGGSNIIEGLAGELWERTQSFEL